MTRKDSRRADKEPRGDQRCSVAEVSDIEYRARLQWQLARGEAWITNADTKATISLGLNGAVIATVGILATLGGPQLISFVQASALTTWLSGFLAASILLSLVTAGLAVTPRFSARNSPGERSIYHFAVVASHKSVDTFREHYRSMTSADDLRTLENMVWVNSRVATDKFRYIQWSVRGLIVSVVIPTLLLLVTVFR